ncbi:Hypothetical predicted protein [Olea europaea subsp. europaea]|uniref:Uncharacterized protein n=1 Tax=Olea europaea subsp. europaea TaxID=158383 RepID=A0A8S0SMK1_OLEEU|nr:Hypothetical predicted protein [Olea europaea subsp. europaea]
MAYSALRSLAQILHQTLNRDYQYLILDEKQQIESLVEKITSLQKDFSLQKITQEAETDIRDAAYIAEDIIESGIIERFRTKSAGHEDGITEKNLIRFDVVQKAFSSISASSRSELEIVGVGGIKKPCTFQTINGIRQLARTRQFKAWFLDPTSVLFPNITAEPYQDAIWAIQRLATCGTKIVIISYYSLMGASETMEEFRKRGFDTSLFAGAITKEDLESDYLERFDSWFDQIAAIFLKMYKSAMVMAGVDAADHCIVVGGKLHYIKDANAAGISSIFVTGNFGETTHGRHRFADITDVRSLAARYEAHPTYLLPSFTW